MVLINGKKNLIDRFGKRNIVKDTKQGQDPKPQEAIIVASIDNKKRLNAVNFDIQLSKQKQ